MSIFTQASPKSGDFKLVAFEYLSWDEESLEDTQLK